MPILLVEILCVVIVATYVVARASASSSWRSYLVRMAGIAVAALVAEDTSIRLYGFYEYSRSWSVLVDQVPLMVILIWPCVIDSAWEVIWHLKDDRRCATLFLAAAMVFADASLIEPIAVQAGLWSWNEPGFMRVPPIGILGWAFFALTCFAVFAANARANGKSGWDLSVILIAPAATHLLLLAAWWGGLRALSVEVPSPPVVAMVWLVSIVLTVMIARRAWGARVPRATMMLRVPPALFFFVLLAVHGKEANLLWIYALAFSPPYVALTVRSRRSKSG